MVLKIEAGRETVGAADENTFVKILRLRPSGTIV